MNNEVWKWDYFNSTVHILRYLGKFISWKYKHIIKGDFNNDSEMDFEFMLKPYNKNEDI